MKSHRRRLREHVHALLNKMHFAYAENEYVTEKENEKINRVTMYRFHANRWNPREGVGNMLKAMLMVENNKYRNNTAPLKSIIHISFFIFVINLKIETGGFVKIEINSCVVAHVSFTLSLQLFKG